MKAAYTSFLLQFLLLIPTTTFCTITHLDIANTTLSEPTRLTEPTALTRTGHELVDIPIEAVTPVSVETQSLDFPPPAYTITPIYTLSQPPPPPPSASPLLHPLSVLLLIFTFLGFLSTLHALPFNLMPSSSSDPKAASSSSSRDPSKPSSSSSSSSKPSSSSSSATPPPKPVPTISANAFMSFFLFCCLVLIILQGPLGLTGGSGMGVGMGMGTGLPGSGLGGGVMGGMPGCAGVVAGVVPWCPAVQQVQVQAPPVIVQAPPPVQAYHQVPQMGGQGVISTPDGGGGYSWYANQPGQPMYQRQPIYRQRQPVQNIQYQRPGLQLQVNNGGMLCRHFPNACQPLIPFAYAQSVTAAQPATAQAVQVQAQGPVVAPVVAPVVPVPVVTQGMVNLENAFYPLLVGAIALLVIFDYAS